MSARHRHAEVPQHRLGLIFVDVHARALTDGSGYWFYTRERSMTTFISRDWRDLLQASTSLHRLADFEHRALGAVELISTMLTPFAPITTGTPTDPDPVFAVEIGGAGHHPLLVLR